MKAKIEEPTIIKVYRRIIKAAEKGVGCRLSAKEVFLMSIDHAITQVIDTYEILREEEKE